MRLFAYLRLGGSLDFCSVLNQHHKATGTLRRRNVIIRTYYDNLPFFAFCCIGAEFFYLGLYLLHFFPKEEPAFEVLRKVGLVSW